MASFFGRSAELRVLEDAFLSRESGFIPVYGRRRVGKSEIILHFIRDKPSLYFVGKKATPQIQIREFLQESARRLEQPLLASLSADSWKAAIEAVDGQRNPGKKFVLVFDEFQWAAKASPELPSVLQELWDRRWRDQGNMLLILCGSYLGFMEKEVLGRESPLFGRRTAQMLLKPFSFREAGRFHEPWSLIDRAKAHFICGGIPFYLRLFSPNRSIDMNIRSLFLSEFGALYREVDYLLREELRELEKYHAILFSLASGSPTITEIAARTGIGDRSLPYYLNQLVELGYVGRRFPLTDRPPSARDVRFILGDPLLRFWFHFVFPNMTFIAEAGPERSFESVIKPNLEAFWGHCYERLCREALPGIYLKEGVSCSFDVGEYWDGATQIDIVGIRADGRVDIGECKWGPVGSLPGVYDELRGRIARYPNASNATVQPRLFCVRSPRVRALPSGLVVHTLKELYE